MAVNYRNRLLILVLIVIMMLFVGIIGYCTVQLVYEPAPPERTTGELIIDGFFWAVSTLSTLGAYPPHTSLVSTAGEILTILMVSLGISTIFIAFPLAIGPWLEARFRRASQPPTVALPRSSHVIICGYSEVGREVISDLKLHDVDYCLIVNDPEKIAGLRRERVPHIHGDATKEETLKQAHIDGAMALVATDEDSTNAFVCLTACKLQPSIRIVASAQDAENQKVLRRAGADKVISPKSIAGVMLGRRALSEYDFDLFGKVALLGGLEVRQTTVSGGSPLIGETLRSSEIGRTTGVKVIGLWREGDIHLNPPPSTEMTEGLILLVMGTEEQLDRLTQML